MAKMVVAKATLSTGKVVLIRKPKISDTETAAQAVAVRANGDQALIGILSQKALVQLLVQKVDDHVLTGSDRERLDDFLEIGEYAQVLNAINQMTGGSESGKAPTLELVSDQTSEASASGS